MPLTARRAWLLALAASLAFRAWLAAALPLTGDEAYFLLWGLHPALGYYDHPPMIGWWLALLARIAHEPWALRLATVLLPAALALMTRAALRGPLRRDAGTADWAGVCVLLVPLNVWNVLVTTDTPLTLFATAAVLVFAGAAQSRSAGRALAAGALLGLAFLSKYFAVLVALAWFGWALLARAEGRWRVTALALAAALPFGLVNLWWNLNGCWSNLMFNAVNRHDDAGWSWRTPALYALTLAYLVAPLLWQAWRARGPLRTTARAAEAGVLLAAWALPLALFALLSLWTRVGLHWLAAFIVPLVLGVALAAGARALAASARWLALLALAHVVLAVAIAALPLETWRETRYHSRIVLLAHGDEIPARVAALAPGARLAADGYSLAATLAFHARRHVPVFGAGSSHARHDDILPDWRLAAGTDLAIVRREAPRIADLRPFFREVRILPFDLHGVRYHVIVGRGFDYPAYRRLVLDSVRTRFYRVPAWLPQRGGCYFCHRYFDGAGCAAPPR